MADAEFKYDVFISYSHKDEEWVVNTLLKRLDDSGLKVCIDYRNFEAGKMALFNMQDAVKQSQHVVLVLTRNWLGSEWSLFEALLGGTKDPAGFQKKLVPLLNEAGIEKDINDFIAMRTWVDFTHKDREAIAWKQLFNSLGTPDTTTPDTSTLPTWNLKHRYGLASNFTGRVDDRNFLSNWLDNNDEQPLLVLRALGGFGKSALTWFWLLHDIGKSKWTRVVWWGFYDDNNFETFLKETLEYLKVEVPQGPRLQVELLLKAMEQQNILLIMDGFERALRAFSGMSAAYQLDDSKAQATVLGGVPAAENNRDLDCISPIAEDFLRGVASSGGLIKAKVLMTTRLTPRILFTGASHDSLLQGCLEKELSQMDSADAVDFFIKQGVRGTRKEIKNACALYGFHPLSLRLLAGLIIKDKRQPMDIAAASRYEQKVSAEAKQRQHHVLEQSYKGLSPESKVLLGMIACFRSGITYDTLVTVEREARSKPKQGFLTSLFSKKPLTINLEEALDDLVTRGLVHCTLTSSTNSLIPTSQSLIYDIHPIVRRFAYGRLTPLERTGVHIILVLYFESVPQREKIEKLEDLAPVIELFYHTVRAGKLDEAIVLFNSRLHSAMYYQFGAYQAYAELLMALFLDSNDKPQQLKKESNQGWVLNSLANAYSQNGQPHRAVLLYEEQISIREKQGTKKNIAIGLGNLAQQQLVIGKLSKAERNLHRKIDLCHEIADEFEEAIGHQELGRVLSYRGAWQEVEQELALSNKYWEETNDYNGLCIDNCFRSLLYVFSENKNSAITYAQKALDAWKKDAEKTVPKEPTLLRTLWLLGASCRVSGNLPQADLHLNESLHRCRAINMVDHEATILLEIAKLRHAQGNKAESLRLTQEALVITERSGYVLQGADVNLMLTTLALEGYKLEGLKVLSDKDAAIHHAKEALRLATCDGPPYYYKVAYEEAVAKLERLKV